jgi:dipeptidase
MNTRVAIGETTHRPEEELTTSGLPQAIHDRGAARSLCLQRAKTAREAIKVMGELAETYGFLPSCGSEGECLTVTDASEAWIFELRSVGMMWTPESKTPGAIWVAQRVPDDMVVVVPNMSRIREVNPEDADNFMASGNYQQFAMTGVVDPASGKPFIWQEPIRRTGNDDWSLS